MIAAAIIIKGNPVGGVGVPGGSIPAASFIWVPSTPIAGQPMALINTSPIGFNPTYSWVVNGVQISTLPDPTYYPGGSFSCTLTVTNPYGQSSATHFINVYPY